MKKFVPVILIVLSSVLLVLCQNDPGGTYPIEYDITLNTTELNSADTFDGDVSIKIGVTSRTTQIRLNRGSPLTSAKVKLFEIDGELEKEISITTNIYELYYLTVSSTQYLEVGTNYTLKIQYVSFYESTNRGLYKSHTLNNEQISMIATNFVPEYASWVFPCYDNSILKAKFTLSIHHPVGYEAISNMDVLDNKANFTTLMAYTKFHTTPSLSIHSIAFAVLAINYRPDCIHGDLKICVYYDNQHTPADVELIQQTTVNAIKELENYLGVALDLSKLDIFPDDQNYPDYRSGSYGILNNNPEYFYYNSTTSSLVQKEIVVRHTIRQVVSLYFGNILVPTWWDDSWLIKGLSVLFEYIIADKLYPEFDEMNQFLSNLYEFGFIDKAVKPKYVTRTAELWYYDGIEHKSAGILYMLKNILGEDIFKNGMRSIFSNASYHLINSNDFFDLYTKLAIKYGMISDEYNLNTYMSTWLTQLGYPYVRITRKYASNYNRIDIFQTDTKNVFGPNMYRTTQWWIPYTCVSQFDFPRESNSTPVSEWINNYSESSVGYFTFAMKLSMDIWVLCNNEQAEFYFINYDPNNYRLLANQLYNDHIKIPALVRAQLLHTGFITAEYELNPFSLIFQLTNYIHQEDTYTALNIFITEFTKFTRKVYGTAPYEKVLQFIASKIGPAYDRIRPVLLNSQTNTLSFTDEKLRTQIVLMACSSGYITCLQDMNILIKEKAEYKDGIELKNAILLDPFITIILHYGMVLADAELFWEMVAMTSQSNEFASVLAFVQNPQLIDQLFEILTIQNYDIINQIQIDISASSRASILEMLLTNNLPALDKTIDLIMKKSTLLQHLLQSKFEYVVNTLADSIKTDERLVKLEELIEMTSLQSSAENALVTARDNVKWCNYRIPEFETTLNRIVGGSNGSQMISVSFILLFSLIFGSQLI